MTRQQSSTHDQNKGKHASDSSSSRAGGRGDTTVREAGQKGGQRVRELVNEGRESEQRGRQH